MLLPEYSNHVEAFLKEYFFVYDTTYVQNHSLHGPFHNQEILTIGEGSVQLTSLLYLVQISFFHTEDYIFLFFFTKQPILMRRSTVLILPLHSIVLSLPFQ
jgi:hypothetical protein